MFLEEWTRAKISQDRAFHCYIGREPSAITRQEMEDFQLFKLGEVLSYAYERSAFYSRLLKAHGIHPGRLSSFAEWKRVPFTFPSDLAESPYKFLCVPLGGVVRIFSHMTSGTTGAPKKIFFSERDIETITDYMAAIMKTAITSKGLDPEGEKVYLLMPDGTPWSQAKLIARGVEKMGGIPLIGDITSPIEEQVRIIEDNHPLMIMGSAFRIYRLSQETRLSHDLRETGVKVIFITSEYMSQAMRRNLEEWWAGEVYHHYGMTESGLAAAIECQTHKGFHYSEVEFFFEVVDPVTGEALDEEAEGEVVLTLLNREAMPLIRYRTGDIASLIKEPCTCGASSLKRIGKITKRIQSIVRIGDEQIYPSLFDDVLYQIPELIDYRVSLIPKGNKVGLLCKIELNADRSGVREEVRELILSIGPIKRSIQAGLLTSPEIEIVERGVLRRVGRVKQRILDERPGSS